MSDDMNSKEEKIDRQNICHPDKLVAKNDGQTTQHHKHIYGLFFSFATGFSFATASICNKRLKYISSAQLTTHCCAGMIFFSLPMILYRKIAFIYPFKTNIGLVLRAVFTAMAFNFTFLSIIYIPLADVSVIGSCSPILTTVFARMCLKEPCGILHCVCLILTIAGVLLVSKIPLVVATRNIVYGTSYFMGVGFSVVGALSFAMANIVVRLPSLISVHYSISVFYIGAVAVIVSAVVTHFIYGFTLPKCGMDRLFLVLQIVTGGSMEMLITKALQNEEASIVIMIVSTTTIVANFLYQTLAEGIIPDVFTTSGAVIVMVCIILIATRRKFTVFIENNCKKIS